ncbi:MAG: hypothetical protein ACK4FV_05875 [Candidatus Nitrosocaldus sp.]
MTIPLRNIIYEKIRGARSITDVELINMLGKEGLDFTKAELNKILLDLEILGLVRVGWISKDKRRIEIREMEERVMEERVMEEREREREREGKVMEETIGEDVGSITERDGED